MSKRGRPSTGSLVWTKGGWSARVMSTVDGERIRRQIPLGTTNKLAAQRKLERLLEATRASEAATTELEVPAETFERAALRVTAGRERDGVSSATDERARMRLYAFPVFGTKPASAVDTADVNEALDYAKAQGKSRQTVAHLRQAIRLVFDALRREGEVKTNPVDDASMPRFKVEVRKERAVLTDEELSVYLAYQHPEERFRMGVLQRQTMACVARCFGGLRTGDLHSLDWSAFDVAMGGFEWGWAPRKKTKRPQLLEVPEMLRPILRDWWERAGRPTSGPVFPCRRGKRVGEAKLNVSHAHALRRDLRRALGVESWSERLGKFETVRAMTRREVELFEETAHTQPVDFHSWRRAFTQALADADVNAQQATALAGHASLSAHARYLASSGKLRKVPGAALPMLAPPAAKVTTTPTTRTGQTLGNIGHSGNAAVVDKWPSQPVQAHPESSRGTFSAWSGGRDEQGRPLPTAERQNPTPKILDAGLADMVLGVALRGLAERIALTQRAELLGGAS